MCKANGLHTYMLDVRGGTLRYRQKDTIWMHLVNGPLVALLDIYPP